jgi:hypothetical protein
MHTALQDTALCMPTTQTHKYRHQYITPLTFAIHATEVAFGVLQLHVNRLLSS